MRAKSLLTDVNSLTNDKEKERNGKATNDNSSININTKRLFAIIFATAITTPAVLAASHTVKSDLSSFANVFVDLFNGSIDGAVSNLVNAIPLFGLIAVIWGLTFFIAKITLFNKQEHDRYAKMFALGITLIGIAQQGVYNAILGWSRSFLILSFIIAIVFMFIMFINHSSKRNYDVSTEKLKSKKEKYREISFLDI